MNGQHYVFRRLYSSKANYASGVEAPLPYCARHKLHESPVPGAYAYCPWVDPIVGAQLRATEQRISDRRNAERCARKAGAHGATAALAKMQLLVDPTST